MNKNISLNTEEYKLCYKIEQIKKSKQIPIFISEIKKCIDYKPIIFSYRIKEPSSAIRSYNLAGYKNSNQLHDLLGFLFVVDTANEIPIIEEKLTKLIDLSNIKIYNLMEEKEFESIQYNKIETSVSKSDYNKLILNDLKKWLKIQNNINVLLPPFSYNILCKKHFSDINDEVPIEFRIQAKQDFLTTESYYYTIHKNDAIPLNIKIPLLCMCFRILRRMSNIAFSNNLDNIKKAKLEIDKIMKTNQKFIDENIEIINIVLNENHKLLENWKNKQNIYGFHLQNKN